MASSTLTGRPLTVQTPLGPNKLLLTGFTGTEAISQLFSFHLDLLAENREEIAFDQLLGQNVTVALELPGQSKRYFNGIVSCFSQGERGTTHTAYRAEAVPQLWLWTRSV